DSLLPLFRDDRDACAAHDCRRRPDHNADCYGGAKPFQRGLVHASGNDWFVLALRRYCLDLPVPAALSDRTHKMTHQAVPVRTYVLVFLALITLTISTVAISKIELGAFNFIVAMTIAVIKGSLVVWFFMNVRQSSPLTRLFVVAGFFWMAILIVFTLSDYLSRGWLPSGAWW